MKEEHENNGMEGPEPDGGVPPPAAARAPLGEWRIAAFWMTCGALLVLLALGAFMLVQRVGVERDMMAVAATATAPAPTDPAPAAMSAPRTAPAMASPPAPAVAAPRIAANQSRSGAALPDTLGARQPGTATAPRTASPSARADSLAPRVKAPARLSGAKAAARPPRQNAARRNLKRSARSEVPTQEGNYAKIFIRCPLPGEPGSVECRRHICNGAESEGPACKPYRGRLR